MAFVGLSIITAYTCGLVEITSPQAPYSLHSPSSSSGPHVQDHYEAPLTSWVIEPTHPLPNNAERTTDRVRLPYRPPAQDLDNWWIGDSPAVQPASPQVLVLPDGDTKDTVATHTLVRHSTIVLDLNLWSSGSPGELTFEFTSPAGSALKFTVDRDGWVRTRTTSAQIATDMGRTANRLTVHLSQQDPYGFRILGGNSVALSGPLDAGISTVTAVRVSASGSTGKWHLGPSTQLGAADSTAMHHTMPNSRIHTTKLQLRPVGTPQELEVEFRSPAGQTLSVLIGNDRSVRAGQHLAFLPADAWSTETNAAITVHIDTSIEPYTFTVFFKDTPLIAAPLPHQFTNTNELRISSRIESGYWEVGQASLHLDDHIAISTAAAGYPTSADVQLTRRIDKVVLTFTDGTRLIQQAQHVDGQTVRVGIPFTAPPITGVEVLPLNLEWTMAGEDRHLARGMALGLVPNHESGAISLNTDRVLSVWITVARAVALLATVIGIGDLITRRLCGRLSPGTHAIAALIVGVMGLACLGIPHVLTPTTFQGVARVAISLPVAAITMWWVLARGAGFVARARLVWVLAATAAILLQVIVLSIVASWGDLQIDSHISQFEGDYLVPYTMAQDMRHGVPLDQADVWGFPFGSRTPLFSMTYLGSMTLFGNDSVRGTPFSEPPTRWQPDGATIYMVVVAVATALMAMAVGLLARSWAGDRAGDLAAAMVAMNPLFIWIALLSPYRALMVMFLLAAIHLLMRPRSLPHNALASIAAAAAYATGRVALPFLPGLLLLPWSGPGRPRRKVAAAAGAIALVGVAFLLWRFVSQSDDASSEWAFLLPFLTDTHHDELRTQSAGDILGAFIGTAGNDPLTLLRGRLTNVSRVLIPGVFLDVRAFSDGLVKLHTLTLFGQVLLPFGCFAVAGVIMSIRRNAMRFADVGMLLSGLFLSVFVLRGSDSPGLMVAVGLPLAVLCVLWSASALVRWPRIGLVAVALAGVEAVLVAHAFWGPTLSVSILAQGVLFLGVVFVTAWAVALLLAGRAVVTSCRTPSAISQLRPG